ncbi:MAG: hypothetical protein KJ811_04685, partial [Candidatus Margulisbacteria bacterium]|nr:hypothetical protein [Candidatus Margulisiibacteriota bacterium]
MIILRLFFSLFIAWLLGYLIVYLFDPQKKIPWFEGAALSFLLGQGVLTLLLFLLLFLPVANRSIVLTGLILVFFGAKLFFDKNKVWVKSSFQFNKKG